MHGRVSTQLTYMDGKTYSVTGVDGVQKATSQWDKKQLCQLEGCFVLLYMRVGFVEIPPPLPPTPPAVNALHIYIHVFYTRCANMGG